MRRLAALIWVALLTPAWAGQQPPRPGLPPSANDLARKAVQHELEDEDPTHYLYRLIKKKPDGTETREVLEAQDVIIARLVALDGKPLTDEQREKEDRRLDRLLTDPDYLHSRQKQQRDDERRTRRMVQALPDAFLYEYAGVEPRPYGEVVVLRFKPNPSYQPPSREQQVYRGMEGTLEVALPAERIAKIEATLFRDVNFGWGILGHLDKGGRFVIEQSRVHEQHWEPTHMVLNFTGRVLLFKSLKIQQDQTTSDYRPVPAMSVAQALEFLKQQDGKLARGENSHRPH